MKISRSLNKAHLLQVANTCEKTAMHIIAVGTGVEEENVDIPPEYAENLRLAQEIAQGHEWTDERGITLHGGLNHLANVSNHGMSWVGFDPDVINVWADIALGAAKEIRRIASEREED
jgi:hypothetical protein